MAKPTTTTTKRKAADTNAPLQAKQQKNGTISSNADERQSSQGLFLSSQMPVTPSKYVKKGALKVRVSEPNFTWKGEEEREVLAKKISKERKSEGDVGRERWEEDEEEEDEEADETQVPARQPRDDEYDEDVGRMESQQFLTLVDLENKKKRDISKETKKYLKKFIEVVDENEQNLKNQIKDLSTAAAKIDVAFLREFKSVYKAATPFASSTDRSKAAKQLPFSSMHEKSVNLVSNATDLIAKFDEASQRITDLGTEGLMNNEWQAEDEKLVQLLADGRDVGIDKFRRILNPPNSKDVVEDAEPAVVQMRSLFYGSKGGEGAEQAEGAWGKVARKQQKAAKKIVKVSSGNYA